MLKAAAHILIIGSRHGSVAAAEQQLLLHGYQVSQTADVEQALPLLQINPPDLILLDYYSSPCQGLAELLRLQELDKHSAIPVILMVNIQDKASLTIGLINGGAEIISIPLHCGELLVRIKNQMQQLKMLRQLEDYESQQSAILYHAHVAVVYTDINFFLTKVNAQFYQIFGNYCLHSATIFDLYKTTKVKQQDFQQQIIKQIRHGGIFETEQQLYNADGRQIWCHIRGKQLRPQHPDVGMVWSIDDISEKKQLLDELRLAATVYQVTGDAIMIMNEQHHVISVNPAFFNITHYVLDDIKDCPVNRLFADSVPLRTYKNILGTLQTTGQWKGECLIKRKNAEAFTAWLLIDTVYRPDNSISHYIAVFSDFSERKQLEEELRYQAENDPLTKLPNRTLFFHRLHMALAGAKRYQYSIALLYIDLDGFKQINDFLGHGRGDAVLIEVAKRLQQEVREMDTVARIGGDEFIVILNRTSNFMIEATVQRILDALDLPVAENQQRFNVTASIGISIYPEHCQNANKLLQYADQAMYRAKHSGKRTFCWHVNEIKGITQ